MTEWHLYMIRAADGSLYTGVATDVARRVAEHREGAKGARYLRGRAPLELVYQRRIGGRGLALKLESRLKRLGKAEKETLVRNDPSRRKLLEQMAIREED